MFKRHIYYDMQGRKHATISKPPRMLERMAGACMFIVLWGLGTILLKGALR